jgi:hypothetical protein
MALFDGQHLTVVPLHIAIAAIGPLGQGARCVPSSAWDRPADRFVDEHQPVATQAEAATAIFVHPAAHAETIGRQAFACIAPVPDAAGAIGGRYSFQNSPSAPTLQFGKVGAGGNGLGGAEGSAAAMRREFRSLRKASCSMVWVACSASGP